MSVLIVSGIFLPWERGYQWSSTGWSMWWGRALTLLWFMVAWGVLVLAAAGSLRKWYPGIVTLLAAASATITATFYLIEIGRRDPRLTDGNLHTHPGVGLALAFAGGAVLALYSALIWYNIIRKFTKEQPVG